MGVYTEYLEKGLDFAALEPERKRQLKRLSALRGRDVLVFAADLNNSTVPTSIDYSDILAVNDQLASMSGDAIDIVLETPGGLGEVVEDIVKLVRSRYKSMAVIVPGWAKSAGTIMAMAADEILMEQASALGPIDAQISWLGKRFSADALIEGIEKIKQETARTGILNKAYVPILQGISPGELEHAKNALDFAKTLVTDWLAGYKFSSWTKHSSTGQPVTDAERHARARDIAERLCNHKHWRTHGRSIKMDDLRAMKLVVTDYSADAELADAVRRLHTLVQMTFACGMYKIFETPTTQIYRAHLVQTASPKSVPTGGNVAMLDVTCGKCKAVSKVQANLGVPAPLQPGCVAYPANDKLECQGCKSTTDLAPHRATIEAQTGKKIVS